MLQVLVIHHELTKGQDATLIMASIVVSHTHAVTIQTDYLLYIKLISCVDACFIMKTGNKPCHDADILTTCHKTGSNMSILSEGNYIPTLTKSTGVHF